MQVIAQQWLFTYRYPTMGGFETTQLVLPVGKWIEFNVTSLDVIHSFWVYKLGVKADANPGVNNVAFVKPTKIQSFWVRCAELCGIWHAAMTSRGRVVSPAAFIEWVHGNSAGWRPRPESCRSTARPTYPNPSGEQNQNEPSEEPGAK